MILQKVKKTVTPLQAGVQNDLSHSLSAEPQA